MKELDIYEVERDEYVGFVDEMKPDAWTTEIKEEDNFKILNVYSKKTKKLLCSRHIPLNENERTYFYIYEMPDNDERRAPPAKRKIVLETREEVQEFFNILSKIQKGDNNG